MKLQALLVVLALSPAAFADETSHRHAASKVLDMTGSDTGLENTLPGLIEPMLQRMRQQGLPADIIEDAKSTVSAWFHKEVKWQDVKPKVVDVWMKHYTEQELNELSKFFASGSGKKFLEQMPHVMRESSIAVQSYMKSKESSLQTALQPLVERAKKAGAGGASGGSPGPAPGRKSK